MAITAVMVDEARVRGRAGTKRVEGTTQMIPVAGPWFKARLFLSGAPAAINQGRLEALPAPQLLFGLRDKNGDPVELHFDEKVEVRSAELGNATWELTQEPEPLRKRRRVIGYLVNLQRVQERETEPVELP